MRVALTLFPTYTNRSLPLGLACINGALRERGFETSVYDFDLAMSVADRPLYEAVHRHAWGGDWQTVNYLGGTDYPLILGSVFDDPRLLEALERRDPRAHRDARLLQRFAEAAVGRLLAGNPDQVWFSTFVSNFWPTLIAARLLKRLAPNVRVVFGGPGVLHPAVQMFVLANGLADACLAGEGERAAVEYLERHGAWGDPVPGMACLRDGQYVFRQALLEPRLENLPRPDFTGFPFPGGRLEDYLQREFAGLPVSFSRGCPQRCAFCTERRYWQRFRILPVEAAVEGLKRYRREYGTSLFYCCDSLINFSPGWLRRFCDLILEERLPVAFSFAFIQGRNLPGELLARMKEAGFSRLFLGLEHGSRRMLDLMRKGTRPEEMKRIIVDAALAGLSLRMQCIANFPGETLEDVLEQVRFFREVDESLRLLGVPKNRFPQRLTANPFRLEPDTEMHRHPERYGLRLVKGEEMPGNGRAAAPAWAASSPGLLRSPLLPASWAPSPEPGAEPATGPPALERPAVTIRHARELMERWEYREPQDSQLHLQLAAGQGFHKDPWRPAPEDYPRIARALRLLIDDDDRFALTPDTRLIRDLLAGSPMAVQHGDRFPLDDLRLDLLLQLEGGRTLAEARRALEERGYSVDLPALKSLVAECHAKLIVVRRPDNVPRRPAEAGAAEAGVAVAVRRSVGIR